MFTGIITDIGTVERVDARGDARVTIATAYDMGTVDLGASIACSGVCLTVVDKSPGRFTVDVSAETVDRTADQWRAGVPLNLERAMKLGDELGGHIVTGHVDGVGEVASVEPEGDSLRLRIRASGDLAPYLATKGSVTIDGVSLTVNSVEDEVEDEGPDTGGGCVVGLNIIPHTAGATTLGRLAPGARVNVEIDVLARYLRRMETYRGR